MLVQYNKRDLIATGGAVFIILIVFIPSILVHFHNVKDGNNDSTYDEDKKLRRIPIPSHDQWFREAQRSLKKNIDLKIDNKPAKNIIFFLGDGMGVSTMTAARILRDQRRDESAGLQFQKFPHMALVSTYCADHIVADSACSSVAYLCGVKANKDTLGVRAGVEYEDCLAGQDKEQQVESLLSWAQEAGKLTGLVTTDRLTGASPAGSYAHSASRDWENDRETPSPCEDIASQLIRREPGRNFRVILGGGRKEFNNSEGVKDGRSVESDLITEWLEDRSGEGWRAEYVSSKDQLASLQSDNLDYLLGIFTEDEFQYRLDVEESTAQPRLVEMTGKALEILSRGDEGFVLFVEAAHIDKAHHDNWAGKALEEVLELDLAVELALRETGSETLILVTADHSHSLTINGYPRRGVDILGYDGLPQSQQRADDLQESFYPTLMYSSGPGRRDINYDVSKDSSLLTKDYVAPATVYKESASHQGEDVAVFATGPQGRHKAHLFRGLMDQHHIPHVLAYGACIGNGLKFCDDDQSN